MKTKFDQLEIIFLHIAIFAFLSYNFVLHKNDHNESRSIEQDFPVTYIYVAKQLQ